MEEIPKNDGWNDLQYDLGEHSEDNARLSALLNEACHVFHHHAEGVWQSQDKDAFAGKLADEIAARPGLVGRLLNTDDRVVKSLTYRALDLLKARGESHLTNTMRSDDVAVTEALRRVEAALGTTYPKSFLARAHELVALASTPGFQRAFPATRLLLDALEVRSAREHAAARLLPFMYSAAAHPDIYAFEQRTTGAEPKVVVWSVHTTVHEWPDFPQFLSWARLLCEKA